jgi:hypothetical protein
MRTEQRQKLEARNGVIWCEICRGLLEGQTVCVICRQRSSKIRKEFPDVVEYCRYIKDTHKKMSRFRQPSTGVSEVDQEIRKQRGPVKAHRPVAEILEFDGEFYTYLSYNRRICERGKNPVEAKVLLAIAANNWNKTLSPNWQDYSWVNAKREQSCSGSTPSTIPTREPPTNISSKLIIGETQSNS